jgi:sensor histidine kinase regulating citrate/malate metabolism
MKSEPHVSPAGKQIIKQIEQLLEERKDILKRNSNDTKAPQSLMNPVIDGVLNHMMMRASGEGVQFEIAEISDFTESIESIISAIDLQAILADLIENAINATVQSESKRVFVSFSVKDSIYELCVQDSGKPFSAETLPALGIIKATTRKEEGGSGIGYMTIFEILRECKASLIIAEYGLERSMFTKSITVRFDDKSEYILLTDRAEEIKGLCMNTKYINRTLKILPI